MMHRRSFLERLGLGAGALLLGRTIEASVREAYGQSVARKRLFMMVQNNWLHYGDFAPHGHTVGELASKGVGDAQLYVADDFSLPPAFAALEPYRKNALLVDGLSNYQGLVDHGSGPACISCVPNLPMGPGDAGGITFDQYAAAKLAKDMPFASIALGPQGGSNESPVGTKIFAAGPHQKVPVLLSVYAAYDSVFGSLVPRGSGGSDATPGRRKKLLDAVRTDVQRARTALAGPERAKLDQMVSAVDDLDQRMTRLGALSFDRGSVSDLVSRLGPGRPKLTLEDQLDLHVQIATTALVTRLTNVIAFSAELGVPSADIVWERLGYKDMHNWAHNRDAYRAPFLTRNEPPGKPDHPMIVMYNYHAAALARTIDTLQTVREGDRTMFDNTVLTWQGESVDQHHPTYVRAPVLAITGNNGYLKTGGRFVRYPVIKPPAEESLMRRPTRAAVQASKPKGARCMADWFCTLGYALGIPTDSFGGGETGPSPEVAKGPLPELHV